MVRGGFGCEELCFLTICGRAGGFIQEDVPREVTTLPRPLPLWPVSITRHQELACQSQSTRNFWLVLPAGARPWA